MRLRLDSLWIVLGSLSLAACTTSVRRAALVPHQQPLIRSGQSMGDNRHELAVGSSTVATWDDPEVVDGANAGIAVPRWHFNGAYRLQPRPNFDLGLIMDWGLDKGSRSLSDDQPDPDNGDVQGFGVSLGYSLQTDGPLSIGFASDLIVYSIPWVEYETCIDPICVLPFSTVEEDRDLIAVLSLGIIPSYRIGRHVSVFAGANLRNHPTIQKSDIEIGPDFEDDEVESGPGNIVASGGAELELANGLRAMLYVYQPIYMDPVRYGPTVGVSLTIPLARTAAPPAAPPPGAPGTVSGGQARR